MDRVSPCRIGVSIRRILIGAVEYCGVVEGRSRYEACSRRDQGDRRDREESLTS